MDTGPRARKGSDADAVKTTVLLPRVLWRAAKIRAMDDGTDLNRVMIAALEAYVRKGGR